MTGNGRFVFTVRGEFGPQPGEAPGLFYWDRLTGGVNPVSDRTSRAYIGLGGVSNQGRYVHYDVRKADDNEGLRKTYVLNRSTGERERSSVLPSGHKARGVAGEISANGRIALFEVPGSAIYIRNVGENRTQRVDIGQNGKPRSAGSWEPTLNGSTGKLVGFTGRPKRTGSGQLRDPQVWVHNRKTGKTILASQAKGGGFGNGESRNITLSPDGGYAAFTSVATNLKAKNPTGVNAVYVRNLATGKLMNVHRSSSGNVGNAGACTGSRYSTGDCVALSKDGRYVTFWSSATNLVPNDTNGRADLFIRDLRTGSTDRVNVNSAGQQSTPQASHYPADIELTPDGEYVLFGSDAPDLTPGQPAPTPGRFSTYLRDRL